MKSHVYLLCHRNGRRFKIGKANNIIRRARSFGLQEIDWSNSIGLELQSEREAFRLERVLLCAFEKFRLTAQQVADDDGVIDGATEWISCGSLPRVDLFIRQGDDIFPHVRIAGTQLRDQVEALTAPAIEMMARREQREAEAKARREARAVRRRAGDAVARAELEAALHSAKRVLWQELNRHLNAGTIVGMAAESHGWKLLLIAQDLDQNERVWQPCLRETQFTWPRGGGGLVTSISEYGSGDARVCSVNLGDSFYSGWPTSELVFPVLADVGKLLRSLSLVALGRFKATLDASFSDESWSLDAHEGLHEFVDTHLPVLQSRRAARLSPRLF